MRSSISSGVISARSSAVKATGRGGSPASWRRKSSQVQSLTGHSPPHRCFVQACDFGQSRTTSTPQPGQHATRLTATFHATSSRTPIRTPPLPSLSTRARSPPRTPPRPRAGNATPGTRRTAGTTRASARRDGRHKTPARTQHPHRASRSPPQRHPPTVGAHLLLPVARTRRPVRPRQRPGQRIGHLGDVIAAPLAPPRAVPQREPAQAHQHHPPLAQVRVRPRQRALLRRQLRDPGATDIADNRPELPAAIIRNGIGHPAALPKRVRHHRSPRRADRHAKLCCSSATPARRSSHETTAKPHTVQ